MSNNIWKVYKLTSPTGRNYIGCTELPLSRRWESGSNYKHNPELFTDIVQYGWAAFTKTILLTTPNEAEARSREHWEIKNDPDGYNIYRGIKPRLQSNNPPSPPKKVLCVETNTVYQSIHAAANETGLSRVKISECCSGKRKRTGGYHWKTI